MAMARICQLVSDPIAIKCKNEVASGIESNVGCNDRTCQIAPEIRSNVYYMENNRRIKHIVINGNC